jgi:ubiquinone/menaquinone biosynthesis C-methylase UbiE
MAEHADPDAEFTGKYEQAGRIGGHLLDRFYAAVRELLVPGLPAGGTVLEVGCGAGYSTERLRDWVAGDVACIGSDIGASLLRKAAFRNAGVPLLRQSAYQLALPDKSVDAVVMLEVLEHLDEPQAALAELRRVARGHVVLSTPREPLWRALNMARGKYLGALGNTPGHVQHWSSAGLQRCVSRHFHVEGVRQPVPWTVLRLFPRA